MKKKTATPKPKTVEGVVTYPRDERPDLQTNPMYPAAEVFAGGILLADAAALVAQAGAPPVAPQAKERPDLRALLDLYEQTPEANTTQRAAIMREIRSGAGDTVKIDTQQETGKKAETAKKVDDYNTQVERALKELRARDIYAPGVGRYDIDRETGELTPVKGKSRETKGDTRKAVGADDLAASNVARFVLADGSACTATVRGATKHVHPYAYLNGAHPSRPYFGKNLFREGMTVEDAVKVRKEHGLDGDLTEGQKRDLKNGRLTFGDDPARLTAKLLPDDTTTTVEFTDGTPPKTAADFFRDLNA